MEISVFFVLESTFVLDSDSREKRRTADADSSSQCHRPNAEGSSSVLNHPWTLGGIPVPFSALFSKISIYQRIGAKSRVARCQSTRTTRNVPRTDLRLWPGYPHHAWVRPLGCLWALLTPRSIILSLNIDFAPKRGFEHQTPLPIRGLWSYTGSFSKVVSIDQDTHGLINWVVEVTSAYFLEFSDLFLKCRIWLDFNPHIRTQHSKL